MKKETWAIFNKLYFSLEVIVVLFVCGFMVLDAVTGGGSTKYKITAIFLFTPLVAAGTAFIFHLILKWIMWVFNIKP